MIISVILSLIILTPIAKIYMDVALPNAVKDPDGATDLRFRPYERFANLREGCSYGKFNNEGYNNLYDYETGMGIDVLIIGSSHMYSCYVMPEDNAANVLMKLSGKKVYNIGMPAHGLANCAINLPAAVKKYKPSDFVVFEFDRCSMTDEQLKNILSHNVTKVSNTNSLGDNIGALRSIYRKYIRDGFQNLSKSFTALYFIKYNLFTAIQNFLSEPQISQTSSKPAETNPVLLNEVFKQISETVKNFSSGTKLILAYHPAVGINVRALNEDGSLRVEDYNSRKIFADACEAQGIYFLDMTERYLMEYEKNYTVPNGFFNTSVGSGHMNKDGYRMFAEEIYKLMQKIEGDKN